MIPALRQFPRRDGRADHVIAPLDDDGGDVLDPGFFAQDPAVFFQKTGVVEEVIFQPGKGAGVFGRAFAHGAVVLDRGEGVFPIGPDAAKAGFFHQVAGKQPPVIGRDQIGPLERYQPPVPGSQERGRRGGTENLPAIVGLAAALERLGDLAAQAEQVAGLRDALERGLAELPGLHVWSQGVPRLPGTSYLRFGMVDADVVLQRLSRLNVAASSGAACSSGGSEPSHVLTAMGVPRDEALCAIRFSLGDETRAEDIALLLNSLPALIEPLLSVATES